MARDAVIYLCRNGDAKPAHRAFFHSYAAHAPGMDADLIVLLKGFDASATPDALTEFRSGARQAVEVLRIPDEGWWSINAFQHAAETLPHERVFFLTSYSRIRVDNWLRLFADTFEQTPNCGVVGATGSYEGVTGADFPNIAMRTNAFMVDRKLFNSISFGRLATKTDNYAFEAGPHGFTKQLVARGLKPIVVDCNGRAWGAQDWPASLTFRSGRQENLIIADNRTYQYDVADHGRRLKLARLAFGDAAHVTPVTMFERLRTYRAWQAVR